MTASGTKGTDYVLLQVYPKRFTLFYFNRVIWMLLFLIGVCFSIYFCLLMWRKWDESPVLVSLETNHYPLKRVPFPAVTVCNVNKVSLNKLRDIHGQLISSDNRFKNISYDQLRMSMRYMHRRIRPSKYDIEELAALDGLYKRNNVTALDLFQLLRKVSLVLLSTI